MTACLKSCERGCGLSDQAHLESPQQRQVVQPSMKITAAVLHLPQSWAPSG